MKRSFLLITFGIILLMVFPSIATASVNAKTTNFNPSSDTYNSGDSVNVEITNFNPASGTYYPGDSVSSSLSFENTGKYTTLYWISYSVQDENGKWYDTSLKSVRLAPGRTTTVTSTWTVPTDPVIGEYNIVMKICINKNVELVSNEKTSAFIVNIEDTSEEDTPEEDTSNEFILMDDFDTFDTSTWYKATWSIGLTQFSADNIDVDNGNLRIKLPANTLNGGEIGSNDLYQYGTYSARMKLPNAPSSITGFFLYLSPDFYNEIDIEVYNDNSGDVFFTTYADGEMQHSVTKNMGFDPTADYHEYRFDYYPESLSFYVDGELMQTWTDGMTNNSMYLEVNAWYPKWLSGTSQTSDQYLLVDWIKHKEE